MNPPLREVQIRSKKFHVSLQPEDYWRWIAEGRYDNEFSVYDAHLQREHTFDGSHNAPHQLDTLKTLLPYCTGLYIIEDADIKGGLLEKLEVPYNYVQVNGTLTGHCVVIRGQH